METGLNTTILHKTQNVNQETSETLKREKSIVTDYNMSNFENSVKVTEDQLSLIY